MNYLIVIIILVILATFLLRISGLPYEIFLLAIFLWIPGRYLHEKAHHYFFRRYGIETTIQIDWNKSGSFKNHLDKKNEKLFMKLPFEKQSKALLAGILCDCAITGLVFIVYFVSSAIANSHLTFFSLILLAFYSAAIIINLFSPGSDGWKLSKLKKGEDITKYG